MTIARAPSRAGGMIASSAFSEHAQSARTIAGAAARTQRYCHGSDESAFDEGLQTLRAGRMTQLAKSLGLDLTDTFARDLEVLTDLFERVVGLLADAEAHAEDLLLTRRQRGEHAARLLREVHGDDRLRRRHRGLVLDEVAEMRILFLADRILERDRLLRDLEDLAHLVERQLHLLRDLFRSRLATELLHEITRRADQLVDRLDHVHRDADRARLVGDRTGDRLADPPRRVRRELVATAPLELVDGLHQTDVAFLDQIQELQAAVRVLLGDGDDETKVRFDHLGLRLLRLALA